MIWQFVVAFAVAYGVLALILSLDDVVMEIFRNRRG